MCHRFQSTLGSNHQRSDRLGGGARDALRERADSGVYRAAAEAKRARKAAGPTALARRAAEEARTAKRASRSAAGAR